MDSNQFNSYAGGQYPEGQGIFTGQQNPYSGQQTSPTGQNIDIGTQPGVTGQNPYANMQGNVAGQNPYLDSQGYMTGQNPYMDGQTQQASSNPYMANQQYVYTEPWMNGSANNSTFFQGSGQQPYYTGQMQNNYSYLQPGQSSQSNGMIGFAITGMVCGILSILSCCLSVGGVFIAVAGLIFSIIALAKKYDGKGMALAGVICSTIGFCMSLIMTIAIYMDL